MRFKHPYFVFIMIAALSGCRPATEETQFVRKPVDEMFAQRAYPTGEIPFEHFQQAVQQSKRFRTERSNKQVSWQFAGPLNMGGRISSLAIHPSDPQTIFIGAASGGVFRSTNSGNDWQAVFDEAEILSIGDVAISPSDPQVIYVGTGEANAGGGSVAYDGFGMYKSVDGGDTWQHKGLIESGSIGRVAVHPANPDIVYVAAMGRLFANNADRGLFRSIDGGNSWENVLFVNDSTGAVDVLIHPDQPDIVYAVTWERVRRPHRRSYGGAGCGIYKSENGGNSWIKLQTGLPVGENIGRIGIHLCEQSPHVLYAIYADKIGYFAGVYKSVNGGSTWTQTNDAALGGLYSSFGWWFGRIVVDPNDENTVYVLGLDVYKTTNGGQSWTLSSSNVHVDQHDLVILPANSNALYLGNDGGLYTSVNAGLSWTHNKLLPITQFYTCEIDEQLPHRLYGGAQDLGTLRTLSGQFDDWYVIYGGDGFRVLVDPTNNNYLYAEYQYGGFARSVNGGLSFSSAVNGINGNDRKNWHTPVVFNPLNPNSLYIGTNKLYKTTQRAIYWQAISNDLTKGPGNGNLVYGTISCMDVNRADTNVIYAGTDDGKVWVTQNEGASWTDITEGLPNRWVTSLSSSATEPATVYVSFSGYRYDSYIPHILKSVNYGEDWVDIGTLLPEVPVNKVLADPLLSGVVYAATDFGMYFTLDDGQNWQMMGEGLPNVPVTDLRLHDPERRLFAATYGRSMYSIDLDELVGQAESPRMDEAQISVWPNPAKDYVFVDVQDISTGIDFELYDASGKQVQTWTNLKQQSAEQAVILKFDQKAETGMYVLKLTSKGSFLAAKRLVINR